MIKIIGKDYSEALQRERMLAAAVDRQQALAMQAQENSIQYNILKREVEINKQLLESMLQRLKEATVSSSLNASNVTILDRAEVPKLPFKPNKRMQVLCGLIVGLMLGIGLALVIDNISDTIKTPEEINYLVQLPVLGVIPFFPSLGVNGRALAHNGSNGHRSAGSLYTIAFDEARSPISEAFRVVRMSILLSNQSKGSRTLLFTSPSLEDGKTTLSNNIAIALSQVNRSVVLIDCDLRRPRVNKSFGMRNARGLSSYLSGEVDLTSIIQNTRVPNLHVVPSGPIPLNPSELLSSDRMDMALKLLAKEFDYVIIDSPPLLAVADGYILSSIVDGVIIVAKADSIPKQVLQRTTQKLSEVNANVLGVVLNQVSARGARYGYGGYYHYGDGNGATAS
ncbi:MAG: polysaccharide biosynthesis tyrosine autokinase [Acidobacteria bacterium]|nr:polysaccharide biosynthesis tyrosine autokinase [Acidobacteriota bacterium]MBI3657371.1 polysaccharide biosynthesis tyrosine autokinase [Acidobacteriota bacterium]